eukprot:5730591-Pyramimonas_sp.AAC.1
MSVSRQENAEDETDDDGGEAEGGGRREKEGGRRIFVWIALLMKRMACQLMAALLLAEAVST